VEEDFINVVPSFKTHLWGQGTERPLDLRTASQDKRHRLGVIFLRIRLVAVQCFIVGALDTDKPY
jgi:hypothetical protein